MLVLLEGTPDFYLILDDLVPHIFMRCQIRHFFSEETKNYYYLRYLRF